MTVFILNILNENMLLNFLGYLLLRSDSENYVSYVISFEYCFLRLICLFVPRTWLELNLFLRVEKSSVLSRHLILLYFASVYYFIEYFYPSSFHCVWSWPVELLFPQRWNKSLVSLSNDQQWRWECQSIRILFDHYPHILRSQRRGNFTFVNLFM